MSFQWLSSGQTDFVFRSQLTGSSILLYLFFTDVEKLDAFQFSFQGSSENGRNGECEYTDYDKIVDDGCQVNVIVSNFLIMV
jgi:hypothetical protein